MVFLKQLLNDVKESRRDYCINKGKNKKGEKGQEEVICKNSTGLDNMKKCLC